MTIANQILESIRMNQEVSRLTGLFNQNFNGSFETSLSIKQAMDMGFVVQSTQVGGTTVSLPCKTNSQFGDH